MIDCVLREATTLDVPAITAIYSHYVLTSTATFEVDAPDTAEMENRLRSIKEQNLPYLVAELDGIVVGYGYASQFRPRPAYGFTVEDTVYVHHGWIGKGVGRRLMDALISSCRAAGCHQVVAVISGNNSAAVALHASQGFHHVGLMPEVGFKFRRWVDIVLMQRAL